MGSHSMQAVSLTVFLLAVLVLCAGLAMGGSILLILVGAAALGVSAVLFRKCKQMEESQQ
jgi:hypothetical protein